MVVDWVEFVDWGVEDGSELLVGVICFEELGTVFSHYWPEKTLSSYLVM